MDNYIKSTGGALIHNLLDILSPVSPVKTMESPFKHLPERFFSPLASRNREHFAYALLLFYEGFLSSPTGVDRDGLVDKLERYCENLTGMEQEEDEETALEEGDASAPLPRKMALYLLKKIMKTGWISEETLQDFTRIVNIESRAKPFFEALHMTATGGGVEYESHIVAIYSLFCSDASADNGHYIVLRAHDHMMRLLDSLKVLSQNIKGHFEMLFPADLDIPGILNAHYNEYMKEIIDRAYTRLKTSDNLSRYRPEIIANINARLEDEEWLSVTADRLSSIRIGRYISPIDDLRGMLEDIRENLRNMDRIIDDIDRRNRMYSRISTEKIRNRLYVDSTMKGKLVGIVRAISEGHLQHELCEHGIFRFKSVSSESCSTRFRGDAAEARPSLPTIPDAARIDELEKGLRERIALQMNTEKIAKYLDANLGEAGSVEAADMVLSVQDYVKLLYAGVYASAEGKPFPFGVAWGDERAEAGDGRFEFRSHRFFRLRTMDGGDDR